MHGIYVKKKLRTCYEKLVMFNKVSPAAQGPPLPKEQWQHFISRRK